MADQAASHFGRIDTWVNGAAVATYSTVEQTTIDEIRRIIEVDLLGTIYGIKAALPYLRRTRGTLINISSVTGERAVPCLATYSAAKHGIVGFSEALRMELDHDQAGVSVTTILPYGINTPFFNHARSKLGVLPRPTPPAYEPAAVAEAIVWAAEHPTRDIVVGGAGKSVLLLQRLSPALLDRLMTIGGLAFKMQQSTRPDDGVDNLFAPAAGATPYAASSTGSRSRGTATPGHSSSIRSGSGWPRWGSCWRSLRSSGAPGRGERRTKGRQGDRVMSMQRR